VLIAKLQHVIQLIANDFELIGVQMDLVSAALAHGPPQIQQVKQHEATFSMVQKGAECPKPSSKRITCVHELVGIGSKESCQVRHVTVSHVSL